MAGEKNAPSILLCGAAGGSEVTTSIAYAFTVRNKTLFVKTSGKDDDLEEVQRYSLAILEAALAAGCTSILSDETALEYALGVADTFESAKFIAGIAPSVCKAAIVCNPAQINDAAFWENVAVNRGVQVRVFKTMPEAEAWLAEGR
jgi:hypothetical protein